MRYPTYFEQMDGMAERLKLLKGDMNGEQFAKILGCERKTGYAYCRGENVMPLRSVVRVCEYFKVSADWLIFGKEK